MLNVNKLIQSFEEIIGWPYESPGTNDSNGIDCSGAFVRAYRAQGAAIYHGSNRIIRAYCSDAFRVTNAEQLAPGMAVWKCRQDGQEPGEYKLGGKFYDPDLIGNYYHIGLVASVSPLRIIHATPQAAKVDTSLSGTGGTPWGWAAHLDAVDYASMEGAMPTPDTAGDWGAVTTVSGGLIMRETAGATGKYMLSIPKGSRIHIIRKTAVDSVLWGLTQWSNRNGLHTGWVKMDYVTLDTVADNNTHEPQVGDIAAGDDAWRWELVSEAYNLLARARGVT